MYIPKHFLATDKTEILSFMQAYSFATIITMQDNLPVASHLPFVVTDTENGIIITSHFAKANTQWTTLEQQPVLIIFTEPHAYISPRHYESEMSVPTWNYIAVHAYGNAKIINSVEQAFGVLDSMIAAFEKEYKQQWDGLPENFKTKMLNGIVCFEVAVTDLQAKQKLSQNKKEAERNSIITTFEAGNDANEKAIAGFMRQGERHE